MEIRYPTKEESNKLREEEFLKLTPSQRVIHFFKMLTAYQNLEVKGRTVHPNHEKGNFVVK